jgi:hypothetical protein
MLGCGEMTRAFAARIAVRLMLFWTLPDRQFGDVSKSHFAGKTRGLD